MSQDPSKLSNPQLNGYAVGVLLADDLQKKGFHEHVDAEYIFKAIQDVWSDKKVMISREQAGQIYTQVMQTYKNSKSDGNKGKGEAFLTDNAKRSEITVLESGVQYEVLEPGKGDVPTADDKVEVHYEGKLLDGQVFDSSYLRNTTAEFGVTQVIQGWQEILQLMKEGEKRKVYIPSEMAYGDHGAGDMIPPGSTLIFDIELIRIVD